MRCAQQLIATIVVFACVGATVTCSRGVDTAQAAAPLPSTPPASIPPPAQAASATPDGFVATGPLVVENQVDVLAERDGVVIKVYADTGRRVHKGDLLAKLDSSQLEADRAAREHAMRGAADALRYRQEEQKANEADLQRAEKMFSAGLNTREQLDHVRFAHDATVWQIDQERENQEENAARIRSLDAELAKTRIVAPFDGVVARRYIRIGQKVAPNDRLFWVTATAPLRVRFTLPQDFISALKDRDRVELSLPSDGKHQRSARVISVSPVVDPASGTIEVVAQLVGPPGDFRPGLMVNIHVKRP